MIRRLRSRHRVTVTTLAVVLPVLFVAAIAVRVPSATVEELPPAILGLGGGSGAELGLVVAADGVALRRSGDDQIEVAFGPEWNEPDVLLYATDDPGAGSALPEDARLLGALGSRSRQRFWLPQPSPARVLFFSLAKGEVVADLELSADTRDSEKEDGR